MSAVYGATISGMGYYVPERVLTNLDLEKMVDTTDEWIRTRTGISERRIAGDDQAASDLCLPACQQAIADAGLSPQDIDAIIIATITPDTMFPATACWLQPRLGLRTVPAFDLAAGCSGFIYASAVAAEFVKNGTTRHVLVAGVEVLSRITDWTDRATCVLFGDGAGAAVISACPPGRGFLSFRLQGDGSAAEHLVQPAGGSRIPASEESVRNRLHTIKMNGTEVFKLAVRAMGDIAVEAVTQAEVPLSEVNYLIPHQANLRIIEAAAKRLGLPMDKVYVNLERYGNTSAASIPIALCEAVKQGLIKQGDNVVLVAFGAGFTAASALLRWWPHSAA